MSTPDWTAQPGDTSIEPTGCGKWMASVCVAAAGDGIGPTWLSETMLDSTGAAEASCVRLKASAQPGGGTLTVDPR